ncbi:hypothetical protein TWF481_008743 [Arthrobotrys musiformis]|uniref:Uncharacterized protein n=1 Tax=Arthrobotrys musiformis TaxID=47236 RepID=A0AAV9WA25_9PEZI
MKLSTILSAVTVASTALLHVSASIPFEKLDRRVRQGIDPNDIMKGIKGDGYSDWAVVVNCSLAVWLCWGCTSTEAWVWVGGSRARACTILWSPPEAARYSSWFELVGDGGAQNWWQMNWNRDGKKLCRTESCDYKFPDDK